jgi:hypothetical protein
MGATWSKSLALQRAQYMGAEFKGKGVNIALGPVVGPLGKVAEGGRNWVSVKWMLHGHIELVLTSSRKGSRMILTYLEP